MAILEPPAIQRIRMSPEEFERLPEGPPFYDYIDGEAILLNKPTGRHQRIQLRLANAMYEHCRDHNIGEVYHDIDVRLPVGNWVGPDILFIAEEHLDRYDKEKGDLYGAPDLAVEITSPTTKDYDRQVKFEQYYRSEVPWLWIVDQDSLAIEEYRWTPEGYLRSNGVLGGEVFKPLLFDRLEIDLAKLTGFQERTTC